MVLLEKYIPGREIQVAIIANKVLGSIELIPNRKFNDYQAKYNPKARTKIIISKIIYECWNVLLVKL